MEVAVRGRRKIPRSFERALEWSAVMLGLVWLYVNARRMLGSGAGS
jgi:hypothetical protein